MTPEDLRKNKKQKNIALLALPVFFMFFVLSLASISFADMVAPNPPCHVSGTIIDARAITKTHWDSPDNPKDVEYQTTVVDIKIDKIELDPTYYNKQEKDFCTIKKDKYGDYGLYKPVSTLQIIGDANQLKKLKGKRISGITRANGDEYGHYFGFRDKVEIEGKTLNAR